MIYSADVRCPVKPNGRQTHSGRRADYDLRRNALQRSLRAVYPAPSVITLPCMVLVTVWLATHVSGDCDGYIAGLLDTISVGKGANRLQVAMHGFPVLLDDALVRGFGPIPGEDRCLHIGAGFDRVSFSVEIL